MKRGLILLVILFSVSLVSAVSNPDIFGHQMGEIDWTMSSCSGGQIMIGISNSGTASCSSFSASSLSALDGDPAQALMIDNDGNVGIGTTTPNARLEVHQAGQHEVAAFIQDTPTTHNVDVWWAGGAGEDWLLSKRSATENGDFWIYNPTGGAVLTLKQGGNVGIGTTSPDKKLQVVGDVMIGETDATGGALFLYGTTAGKYSTLFTSNGNLHIDSGFGSGGDDDIYLNHYAALGANIQLGVGINKQSVYFNTNGIWRADGNVGIGTTGPSEKLDVVGNIKASGTVCDSTGCIGGGSSGGLSVLTLGDTREHSNYRTSCVVLSDGSVSCWGANGVSELGIGQEASARYLPETVPLPSAVKTLALGRRNNYALLENGQVYSWGTNGNGQLGIGSTTTKYVPVRAGSLTGITQLVASQAENDAATVCALKSDTTVWCWGYNGYGQVGDSTTTQRNSPVQVSGLTGVIDINVVGGQYANSCALKSDGTVWCWGHGGYGQMGDGSTASNNAPAKVVGLTGIDSITSTDTGSIGHKCALKSDGTVWCWGYNGYGQLGDATTTQRSSPVKVSGLSNVRSIALGGGRYGSSLAILNDGTIRLWGYNGYGQLGDSTTTQRNTPINPGLSNVKQAVQAGMGTYTTTAVLLNDGTVRTMGYNGHGQIGDGTTVTSSSPIQVLGLTNVETIWARGASNEGYFCALLTDGRLKCWGYNGEGQLGTGNTRYASVPLFVRDM